MKISEFLTTLEQDKLGFVARDEVMLGAIKKVILSSVYFDGTLNKKGIPDPLKNFTLAFASRPGAKNEELGAELRAGLRAVQLLDDGFKELAKFGIMEVEPKKTRNEAR